jgi:hypothetical protein
MEGRGGGEAQGVTDQKKKEEPEFLLKMGTLPDRAFRARQSPSACPDGSDCSSERSTETRAGADLEQDPDL